MSRRVVLWIAFVLVHAGVAALGFLMPNEPMGDVYRVYEPWSSAALNGAGIVGVDSAWVYPQLALVPMVLAHGFAALVGSYTLGWALLAIAVDAAAFALLVGRAASTGRCVAAWFWLASIAALGPVGMYRLDGITVALAIAGSLWLVGRPWLGSMLLAAATWIKVWPAAILAAAFIAVRRRWAIAGGAVVVSAITMLAVVGAGGIGNLFGFIGDQSTRGLQVEAPISMPYLWGALLGWDGFWVYYDSDLLTFQVTGTDIDPVIAAMTPIMVIAIAAIAVIGAVQAWRGARFATLFPVLSLALVTAFIAFNKVGSPQYLCWIVPPLVIGLVLERRAWAWPAGLGLVLAVLTQLVYPVLYLGIIYELDAMAITVLTVRNILVVVLLVWMTARLVRLPVGEHRRHPSSALV